MPMVYVVPSPKVPVSWEDEAGNLLEPKTLPPAEAPASSITCKVVTDAHCSGIPVVVFVLVLFSLWDVEQFGS